MKFAFVNRLTGLRFHFSPVSVNSCCVIKNFIFLFWPYFVKYVAHTVLFMIRCNNYALEVKFIRESRA